MRSGRVMEDSVGGASRFPARTIRAMAWFCLLATATGSTAIEAQELRDPSVRNSPPTAANQVHAATNQSVSIDEAPAVGSDPMNAVAAGPERETNPEAVNGPESEVGPGPTSTDSGESRRSILRGLKKRPSADLGFGSTEPSSTPWYRTGLGALAVVLALIGGLYVLARRWLPSARIARDDGAMRVVGRTALSSKQNLALIRVGRRFVVVGVSPDRVDAVCEIADPDEVADLVAQTGAKGSSGSSGFAGWLNREAADYVRRSGDEDGASSGDARSRASSKPLSDLLGRLRTLKSEPPV